MKIAVIPWHVCVAALKHQGSHQQTKRLRCGCVPCLQRRQRFELKPRIVSPGRQRRDDLPRRRNSLLARQLV